jgi:hypothetical protein
LLKNVQDFLSHPDMSIHTPIEICCFEKEELVPKDAKTVVRILSVFK